MPAPATSDRKHMSQSRVNSATLKKSQPPLQLKSRHSGSSEVNLDIDSRLQSNRAQLQVVKQPALPSQTPHHSRDPVRTSQQKFNNPSELRKSSPNVEKLSTDVSQRPIDDSIQGGPLPPYWATPLVEPRDKPNTRTVSFQIVNLGTQEDTRTSDKQHGSPEFDRLRIPAASDVSSMPAGISSSSSSTASKADGRKEFVVSGDTSSNTVKCSAPVRYKQTTASEEKGTPSSSIEPVTCPVTDDSHHVRSKKSAADAVARDILLTWLVDRCHLKGVSDDESDCDSDNQVADVKGCKHLPVTDRGIFGRLDPAVESKVQTSISNTTDYPGDDAGNHATLSPGQRYRQQSRTSFPTQQAAAGHSRSSSERNIQPSSSDTLRRSKADEAVNNERNKTKAGTTVRDKIVRLLRCPFFFAETGQPCPTKNDYPRSTIRHLRTHGIYFCQQCSHFFDSAEQCDGHQCEEKFCIDLECENRRGDPRAHCHQRGCAKSFESLDTPRKWYSLFGMILQGLEMPSWDDVYVLAESTDASPPSSNGTLSNRSPAMNPTPINISHLAAAYPTPDVEMSDEPDNHTTANYEQRFQTISDTMEYQSSTIEEQGRTIMMTRNDVAMTRNDVARLNQQVEQIAQLLRQMQSLQMENMQLRNLVNSSGRNEMRQIN